MSERDFLDENRLKHMVFCALDGSKDPRYETVLLPAAQRANKPWEMLAAALVFRRVPTDFNVVKKSTWEHFQSVRLAVALEAAGPVHTHPAGCRKLAELFGQSARIERIARIGDFPKTFPLSGEGLGNFRRLLERIDRSTVAWMYAFRGDPRREEFLLNMSMSPHPFLLDAFADVTPLQRTAIAEAIMLAIAAEIVPVPDYSDRTAVYLRLADFSDFHLGSPVLIETYFNNFAGFSDEDVQILSLRGCGSATVELGKRMVPLQAPAKQNVAFWLDGLWRSVPFVGRSDEADLEILRKSRDPIVRYAVYRKHANEMCFNPEDPFEYHSCDRLSVAAWKEQVEFPSFPTLNPVTYQQGLEFINRARAIVG